MDYKLLFMCYFLIVFETNSVLAADWSYDESSENGPKFWGRVSPNCDGKRQSPINLNWFEATPVLTGPRLTIQNIDKRPSSIKYENDGHGVSVTLNFLDGIQPRITGGPLRNNIYILHSLHMHWKSEHTINHKYHEAELHLVHYNAKYASLEQAVQLEQADGLAVLGFVYFIPAFSRLPTFDLTRPFFEPIINVREYGAIHVEDKNLFSLFDILGKRAFTIWNYNGSLTTPSCNEVVNWMVYKHPLPINPSELLSLRQIKNEKGVTLIRNNRPIQALNGRTILCH